jgi:hypothetical protein
MQDCSKQDPRSEPLVRIKLTAKAAKRGEDVVQKFIGLLPQ